MSDEFVYLFQPAKVGIKPRNRKAALLHYDVPNAPNRLCGRVLGGFELVEAIWRFWTKTRRMPITLSVCQVELEGV